MLRGHKICVVMPAYNAEKTLRKTYESIPFEIVDEVVLVDDASRDDTVRIARELGINHIIVHERNKGYGGNQKSCYDKALSLGADIIVMLHPDYQYPPPLIGAMCWMIATGYYDVVIGSRILGKKALEGGMPLYKYISNRILTLIQNVLTGNKLTEYHTGFRAFHKKVLLSIPYKDNSDDFVFDNELLCQILYAGFNVGEISVPTRYDEESSSINFRRSIVYGLGVLRCSIQYFLHKNKIVKSRLFAPLDEIRKRSETTSKC